MTRIRTRQLSEQASRKHDVRSLQTQALNICASGSGAVEKTATPLRKSNREEVFLLHM